MFSSKLFANGHRNLPIIDAGPPLVDDRESVEFMSLAPFIKRVVEQLRPLGVLQIAAEAFLTNPALVQRVSSALDTAHFVFVRVHMASFPFV
jgi:hypothetical protein